MTRQAPPGFFISVRAAPLARTNIVPATAGRTNFAPGRLPAASTRTARASIRTAETLYP
jgi:hypothetical protein